MKPSKKKTYWMYGRHAVEAALENPARVVRQVWVVENKKNSSFLEGEQANGVSRGEVSKVPRTHPHDSASPLRGSQSSAPPSRGSWVV